MLFLQEIWFKFLGVTEKRMKWQQHSSFSRDPKLTWRQQVLWNCSVASHQTIHPLFLHLGTKLALSGPSSKILGIVCSLQSHLSFPYCDFPSCDWCPHGACSTRLGFWPATGPPADRVAGPGVAWQDRAVGHPLSSPLQDLPSMCRIVSWDLLGPDGLGVNINVSGAHVT